MEYETLMKEIDYCKTVLKKTIIDSEERDDRKSPSGYVELAKKHLYMDFVDGQRMFVHHLNGDRSDNRLCNLVVVTPKEHVYLHKTFFLDEWEVQHKRNGLAHRGNSYNKGIVRSAETRQKMSKSKTGRKLSEETKAKLSKSISEYWAKKKKEEAIDSPLPYF